MRCCSKCDEELTKEDGFNRFLDNFDFEDCWVCYNPKCIMYDVVLDSGDFDD
jgi:hypothetical protein